MRTSIILLISVACVRSSAHHDLPAAASEPAAYSRDVQDGFARVKAATAAYRVLDSAVAKGYAASVPQCFADSTHGAMGFTISTGLMSTIGSRSTSPRSCCTSERPTART